MSLLFLSFVAGIVSFLSPCVLPLIPGYLSFICGTDLENLQKKSKYFILEKSLLFVLGFSTIFILLGASSTFFGSIYWINFAILYGSIFFLKKKYEINLKKK